MRDETGPARASGIHECFTELLEGRVDSARARFDAETFSEAQELLLQHRRLEEDAGVSDPSLPAGSRPSATVLDLGAEFDGFRLVRLIGRGGTGEVFEAFERGAGRPVAIKFLPRELSREGGERMHREAVALAALEHRGIARLYRAGEIADAGSARRYIAMELVRGAKTLAEWRDSEPRSARACVQIVAEICEAVAYAHGRGVIHCDLKPGNILVGADGRAVVIDFGIARILDADGSPSETVSILGDRVAGTLAYISPESLDPRRAADVRADVHALGAILYELLAQRPFRPLESLALAQRLELVGNADPPRLAVARPDLRGDLDRIVARATARAPEERYASASQFAADLRAHLDGRPVLPELQSRRERLLRGVQRNRAAVAVAAVIVATLLAATVVSLRFAAVSREDARLANLSAASRAIDDADLLIAKQHLASLGPDDGTPEHALIERAVAMQGQLIDAGDWYAVAWGPDGTWFVANGHASAFDEAAQPILTRFDRGDDGAFRASWSIPAAESAIHGCVVTPDGSTVLDVDGSSNLRLIDPKTGSTRSTVGPPDGVSKGLAIAVRADGLIAVEHGIAELRPLAEPDRLVGAVDPAVGTPRMLAFAPPPAELVACAGDEGAVLIDTSSGAVRRRFNTPAAFQTALCWSEDGQRILIGGWDRTVRAYSPDGESPVWTAHGHRDSIWSVESIDAGTIATAGADGSLRLWSTSDGAPIAAIPISDDVVWTTDLDPRRNTMLVGSRQGLRCVSMDRLRDWAGTSGHRSDLARAAGTVAEPSQDGRIMLHTEGGPQRALETPGAGPVDKVALARDQGLVAALRRDGTISVLALPEGRILSSTRELASQDAHEPNGISGLALDGVGRRLLVASRRDGCVAIDIDSGSVRWRASFGSQCTGVAVSADGATAYISDRDGQLARVHAGSGAVEASTRRQRTRAACLAVTDDGSRLLVGGADGSLRILDGSSLEEQLAIQVSSAPMRSIRMTPAGIETIDKLGIRRIR